MTEGYPADAPNIALIGKAGAGKDTVADLLRTRFRLGYQRVALADPLKDIASILWGQDARTDRAKLQGLGIKIREIHEDTWIDLMLRHIDRLERDSTRPQRFVVTDCRFPNEYRALRKAGFLMVGVYAPVSLRIDRLKRIGKLQHSAQLDHPSEKALDVDADFPRDWVLANTTTEEDLVDQLTAMFKRVVR